MTASCKCLECGHTFSARVLEDDPTINSFVTDPDCCPECGSEEIDVEDVDPDDDYFD